MHQIAYYNATYFRNHKPGPLHLATNIGSRVLSIVGRLVGFCHSDRSFFKVYLLRQFLSELDEILTYVPLYGVSVWSSRIVDPGLR